MYDSLNDWNARMINEWSAWMDQMEIDYVNGELQVIADEERAQEIWERWVEEIGTQFLTFAPEELNEDFV